MGRPCTFNPITAERVCQRLAAGESLSRICEDEDMPAKSTVTGWVLADHEGFAAQYARAREAQAEHYAEEIVQIADTEGDSAKARNRIDARKWTASKLLPKRYGDRVELEHSGSIQSVSDEQIDKRLTELLARLPG
jgi:hypothetical protein